MKVSEVLQKAQALIWDKDRWTTGLLHDGGGRMCAVGALNKTCNDDPCSFADQNRRDDAFWLLNSVALEDLGARPIYGSAVVEVNNQLGHAATMRMFDIAISLALGDDV